MLEMNELLLLIAGLAIGFIAGYLFLMRANQTLQRRLVEHEARQAIESELGEKAKVDEEEMVQRFRDSFAALDRKSVV